MSDHRQGDARAQYAPHQRGVPEHAQRVDFRFAAIQVPLHKVLKRDRSGTVQAGVDAAHGSGKDGGDQQPGRPGRQLGGDEVRQHLVRMVIRILRHQRFQ